MCALSLALAAVMGAVLALIVATILSKALVGLNSVAIRTDIREKALRQGQDYLSTFVGALGYRAEFR